MDPYVYKFRVEVPKDVKHAKIDSTTKEICKGAFKKCNGLESIDFSEADQLTKIGENAFYRCSKLKAVKFPPNLRETGSRCFYQCQELESIDFSKATKLTEIGGTYTFWNCKKVRKIALPPNLEDIGYGTFCRLYELESIDFTKAQKITKIGEYAFWGCTKLKQVDLPSNVKEVQVKAFGSCFKLKCVTLNDGLEILSDGAFEKCRQLKKISLPQTLKECGEEAFYGCKGLESIDLNQGLETIGSNAFLDCVKLTEVKIPRTVTFFTGGYTFGISVDERKTKANPSIKIIDIIKEEDNPGKDDSYLPLAIVLSVMYPQATQSTITMDDLLEMYKLCPIKERELMTNTREEKRRLEEIKLAYVKSITDDFVLGTHHGKHHGWVQFVANHAENGSKESEYLIEFLQREILSGSTVEAMANAKDREGRRAIALAKNHIRNALNKRLFFLGRYDFPKEGPPIHKSATCVVLKAVDYRMEEYYEDKFDKHKSKESGSLDEETFRQALKDLALISNNPNDEQSLIDKYFKRFDTNRDGKITKDEFKKFCLGEFGRNVILKFMRNKDQYQREIDGRGDCADSKYIVRLLSHHVIGDGGQGDATDLANSIRPYLSNDNTATSSSDHKPEEYRYVLVMPYGDRNLDTIFRSERPGMVKVRQQMKEIGEAIYYLHQREVIHGDLKMLNVVRVQGRLKVIDLDASARIKQDYAGGKFSSGVLPPEMIHCFDNRDISTNLKETDKLLKYIGEDPYEKEKRGPKYSTLGYVVKSFSHTTEESQTVGTGKEGLPYALVKASPSLDVWSYGVLLFQMCTGETLFRVNRDDDITTGDGLKELYEWEGFKGSVNDPYANDLLKRILQRDPKKRPRMDQILNDPFFCPGNQPNLSVLNEKLDNISDAIVETQKLLRDEFSKLRDSQKALATMLADITEGKIPKYFAILPKKKEDLLSLIKGKGLDPKAWMTTTVRLYFICPITLQGVYDSNGNTVGYDISLPKDWVTRYGPTILLGLQVLRFVTVVGRGFGLPLLQLEDLQVMEKHLAESSDMCKELQGFLVEKMGGKEGNDITTTLCSGFEKGLQQKPPPALLLENHKIQLLESYKGIGELVKDEEFERCGLDLVSCPVYGTSDYVHPDIVDLYRSKGKDCYNLTFDEIDDAKAKILATKRRAKQQREAEIDRRLLEKKKADDKKKRATTTTMTTSRRSKAYHQRKPTTVAKTMNEERGEKPAEERGEEQERDEGEIWV